MPWTRISTSGRVFGGESETIWTPNNTTKNNIKRGIIVCHGANGNFTSESEITADTAVGDYIASHDYYAIAADLGGPATFGNDTVISRIQSAWNILKTLGCKPDKAIGLGVSMGQQSLLVAARANAVPFAAILGIIGLSDLDDLRDNNRLGLRDSVNTAWGLTLGSTSGTVALPTRSNPIYDVNVAAAAGSCRFYFSASSADTVIPIGTVQSLNNKLLAQKAKTTFITHSTTLDHSDPSIVAAMARPELDNFMQQHSY